MEKATYLAYLSPTHPDERSALRVLKGAFATVDNGVFGQGPHTPSPELVVAARTHISRRLQRTASELIDDLLAGQRLRIGKIGAAVVEVTGDRGRLNDPGLTEMRVIGSVCRNFTGVDGFAITAKLNELSSRNTISAFAADAFAHGLSRNPDLPDEIGQAMLCHLDEQFSRARRHLAEQPRFTQTEEAFQAALAVGAVCELANHTATVQHSTRHELSRQLTRANQVIQRAEQILNVKRSAEAETAYAICVARLSASPNDFTNLSPLNVMMDGLEGATANPFRHHFERLIDRTLDEVRLRGDEMKATPITGAEATILAAAFCMPESTEALHRTNQCISLLTDGHINPLVSVPLTLCNIGYTHLQGSFTADHVLAICAHHRRASSGSGSLPDTYEDGTGDDELDDLLRGIRIKPPAIEEIFVQRGTEYISPILQGLSGLISTEDIKQLALTPSRTSKLWELLAKTPHGAQALAEMAACETLQGRAEYGDIAVLAAASAGDPETLQTLEKLIDERIELRAIVMENTNLRLADRLACTDRAGTDLLSLLYLLENTSEWGVLPGNGGEVLRRELGLLLPRHAPEKLEGAQLGSLPLEVRLWVGDALGNAVDVRAVTVLGSVLDEMKGRAKADNTVGHANTLAFLSIERLAWFYEVSNQPEKAAQTWAKIEEYYIGDVWVLPDALWQAGRFYGRSGHKDLAQEYLAKAESYHHPLFSSFVSYDQARALFAEGKPLDARALIQSKLVPPNRVYGPSHTDDDVGSVLLRHGKFRASATVSSRNFGGSFQGGQSQPGVWF